MPGFVIDGKQEDVLGLSVRSWLDDPDLRLHIGEDGRPRFTRWIRGITLHTTRGIPGGRDPRPQRILPGMGPTVGAAARIAKSWAMETRQAGAHLIVDFDGTIVCLADLKREVAYHAGEVNEVTIGMEIVQGHDAELYEGQLQVVVKLVDFLTARFGIQRQMPLLTQQRILPRIAAGGKDVVGVYGHRHVTTNRGAGDPGDAVFERLQEAGYEAFDVAQGQDLAVWKERQRETLELDAELCDGIAGPGTLAMLKARGFADGMWVARPQLAGAALVG